MTLLLCLTTVCILASMGIAYARSRDPLHPLIFIGPMLLYVYVARPGVLYANGQLERWIPNPQQLLFSQTLFSAGIALFCIGALRSSRGRRMRHVGPIKFTVPEPVRQRMFLLGCLFGTVSLAAYGYAVIRSGGFVEVYSRSKAQISAGSGWINELVNLSIPSVALLVLSWQGRARNWYQLPLALICGAPLLVHGLLGARRGPTFMILSTLIVSWYLASRARMSIFKVVTRFALIGLLVMFLVSHRRDIHIGSAFELDIAKLMENVAPSVVDPSDDTVFHYGFVNGIRAYDRYFWGVRYFVTYFIRPIPRQLWPTKYEDMGLGWMVQQGDFAGITDEEWRAALGWVPVRGSAAGFVADLYNEFSYFGLAGCLLLGAFYGALWRRAHQKQGFSVLVFVEAAALSVYVPTQSISAVFHRFLFMWVFTWLIWRLLINRPGAAASYRHLGRPQRYIFVRLPPAAPASTSADGNPHQGQRGT